MRFILARNLNYLAIFYYFQHFFIIFEIPLRLLTLLLALFVVEH